MTNDGRRERAEALREALFAGDSERDIATILAFARDEAAAALRKKIEEGS